jgi:hypothetical protein
MIKQIDQPSELLELDYDKFHPLLYHLYRIDWAIFGTLTWESEYLRTGTFQAEKRRKEDFDRLLQHTCWQFKIRRDNLICYRAMEWGGGECHYHFLIGRKGIERLDLETLAKTMNRLWQDKLETFDGGPRGIGRADVQPYDQVKEGSGVSYCLKREFNQYGEAQERFDWLSGGLKRILKRQPSVFP